MASPDTIDRILLHCICHPHYQTHQNLSQTTSMAQQLPASHPILIQVFFQGWCSRVFRDAQGLYHHTPDPNYETNPDDNWTQSTFASLIEISSSWTYSELVKNLENVLIAHKDRSLAKDCEITSVKLEEIRFRWKGTDFVTGEKSLFSVVGTEAQDWERIYKMLAQRGWKDVGQLRYDAA